MCDLRYYITIHKFQLKVRFSQKNHWQEHKKDCAAIGVLPFLTLVAKWKCEALKEKTETGSDEPEMDIVNRLQVEAFKDPKFRKKYGHMFDIEMIEKRVAEKISGHDLRTIDTACGEPSKEYSYTEGNEAEMEESIGQGSDLVTAAQQLSLEEEDGENESGDYCILS